jgi:hypothetical protein
MSKQDSTFERTKFNIWTLKNSRCNFLSSSPYGWRRSRADSAHALRGGARGHRASGWRRSSDAPTDVPYRRHHGLLDVFPSFCLPFESRRFLQDLVGF